VSDAGTNMRSDRCPARPAKTAISPGSPPRRTTAPYIWNVNAPPRQMTAAVMCTNRKNSYQVTGCSFSEAGFDDHHEDDREVHDDEDPRDQDEPLHLGAESRARPLYRHPLSDAAERAREVTEGSQGHRSPSDQTEHDEPLAPVPVAVAHEQDPGDENDERRRHEDPANHDTGVLAERSRARRISRCVGQYSEHLHGHGAADPQHRGRDVQEQPELVRRHGTVTPGPCPAPTRR